MLPEIIAKLMALSGTYADDTDDTYWEIYEILNDKTEEYSIEIVDEQFEDGGRWSNIETTVYRVEQNGVVKYFELWREVPATELQEGQDQPYGFYEVVPKEVKVIKYVRAEEDE